MEQCVACGAPLCRDDIGLSKKLMNRGAEELKCTACLAEYYQVSAERLRQMAEHWRNMGCTLFGF